MMYTDNKNTCIDNYLQMTEIAQRLGYKDLTPLQNKALQMKECTDPQAWFFVIGATSSGKTLIPLLDFFRRKLAGEKIRMLFVVPYRALAQQKMLEIQELAETLELSLNIQQSTSEFRESDNDIRRGLVDVAVIIYEKVFMFACMDSTFLHYYNLLIADELGLTQHIDRGIKVDFVLTQCRALSEMKLVALGTPFYDWSEYVRAFGFVTVYEPDRPVKILEYPIYCYKNTVTGESVVDHVSSGCQAIAEGVYAVPHNKLDDPNPRQWTDPLIIDLCKYHLDMGHKILIFENNREEVHHLSQRLYRALKLREKIFAWNSLEDCKAYISKALNVSENDLDTEFYGILTDADYEAFSCGVSYHNAQMPNKLRTLVEKEILNESGHLRIVCCTETLAYGINSNVDVVIIPDMMKQNVEDPEHRSFLSANEYKNYAGRAGRLQQDKNKISCGYVYPILRGHYLGVNQKTNISQNVRVCQKTRWEQLLRDIENPKRITSQYFSIDTEGKPFYLLSLFPHSMGTYAAISLEKLEGILRMLPRPEGRAFRRQEDLISPLNYLLSHALIRMDDDSDGNAYILEDSGAALTGFIMYADDYDRIIRVVQKSILLDVFPLVDLLYAVVKSREMNFEIKTLFRKKKIKWTYENLEQVGQRRIEQKMRIQNVADILRRHHEKISPQFKSQISHRLGIRFPGEAGEQMLREDAFDGELQMVAALLFWIEINCNTKKMYDLFHISYPQLQHIADKVSYYLDIVALSFPAIKAEKGALLSKQYGYIQAEERLFVAQKDVKELSNAIYYQAPCEICRFLQTTVTCPNEASEIRCMTRLYYDLRQLDTNVKKMKKLSMGQLKKLNKCIQILENVRPAWKKLFLEKFKGAIEYGL